jgi:hypothetical protein
MATFQVGATDVETYGCIQSWDGILSEGPYKGDLLEQDWVAGAEWVGGPRKVYSFDVPILLDAETLDANLVSLDAIKAWHGNTYTLYRIFTVNAVSRTQACTGVMVTDIQPNVLAGKFIKITLVFQNLSGYWYTV